MKTPHSILLVDDDPFVLEVLTLALREVPGWTVLAFASPLDALDACAAEPRAFDVVITDYLMPAMNGGELGRACARSRRT
jgi:CheY-like chemotaxis protein